MLLLLTLHIDVVVVAAAAAAAGVSMTLQVFCLSFYLARYPGAGLIYEKVKVNGR